MGLFKLEKALHSRPLRRALSRALRDQRHVHRAIRRGLAITRSFAAAPKGVYVMCYHAVRPDQLDALDRQFEYIGRHARFVDAETVLDLIASGQVCDERRVLVTVDDGYRDGTLSILPALAAHRIQAIAFIIAERLAGGRLSTVMTTPEAQDRTYMSSDDLRVWARAGMQVGSHSRTHRRLAELTNAEVASEMASSRATLAATIGRQVDHFACPWGQPTVDFDPDREQELARAAGYRSLFTTVRGVVTEATSPYAIPRYVIEPDWDLFEIDAVLR